jgi:hypothetical protein
MWISTNFEKLTTLKEYHSTGLKNHSALITHTMSLSLRRSSAGICIDAVTKSRIDTGTNRLEYRARIHAPFHTTTQTPKTVTVQHYWLTLLELRAYPVVKGRETVDEMVRGCDMATPAAVKVGGKDRCGTGSTAAWVASAGAGATHILAGVGPANMTPAPFTTSTILSDYTANDQVEVRYQGRWNDAVVKSTKEGIVVIEWVGGGVRTLDDPNDIRHKIHNLPSDVRVSENEEEEEVSTEDEPADHVAYMGRAVDQLDVKTGEVIKVHESILGGKVVLRVLSCVCVCVCVCVCMCVCVCVRDPAPLLPPPTPTGATLMPSCSALYPPLKRLTPVPYPSPLCQHTMQWIGTVRVFGN